MEEKNIAISVIKRMEKNLNTLTESKNYEEISEAKENLLIDAEDLFENIDEIEKKVEEINENTGQEIERDRKNNEIIREDKNNSLKNLKMLFGIIALLILSVVGIAIYKNLPKSEQVQEEVTVADPNNFRITNSTEEDEDKAFEGIEDIKPEEISTKNENLEELKNEKEEKVNLEKNIESVEINNLDENRVEKEHEELDRAIAELEGDSNADVVLGRKNVADGLAFFRKGTSKDENEKKSIDRYKINNNINNNAQENQKINNEINRKNKLASSFNDFEVKQGSIIPAIFLTEVNTDLPGTVLAQVRENIYDTKTGNILLVPKGSKLYGRYESNVFKGQTRVFLVWDRLSLPNGKHIELTEFHSTDNLGNSGVSDKTNNHTWSLIGNAILSSVLNFTDTLASGVSFNVAGMNIGLNGQSKESKDGSPFKEVTSHLVKKEVERQPTITIRRGFKFNIIVNGDLELEKYKY